MRERNIDEIVRILAKEHIDSVPTLLSNIDAVQTALPIASYSTLRSYCKSIADALNMDFGDLFQEIQFANEDDDDQDLLDFVLMKLEDLVAPEDEKDNWWKGCDEPAENEIKVMMDDRQFWKDGAALGKEYLAKRDAIPKNG